MQTPDRRTLKTCFLRIGNDSLDDAVRHPSLTAVKVAYMDVARDLDRFGQRIEATIHIANNRDSLAEYPDFVLSIGPRGGLVCQRT